MDVRDYSVTEYGGAPHVSIDVYDPEINKHVIATLRAIADDAMTEQDYKLAEDMLRFSNMLDEANQNLYEVLKKGETE